MHVDEWMWLIRSDIWNIIYENVTFCAVHKVTKKKGCISVSICVFACLRVICTVQLNIKIKKKTTAKHGSLLLLSALKYRHMFIISCCKPPLPLPFFFFFFWLFSSRRSFESHSFLLFQNWFSTCNRKKCQVTWRRQK